MSVEFEVKIDGTEELRTKIERLDLAMQVKVHDRIREQAELMKTVAQSLAPVKTGRLRNSIYAQVEDWIAKVGASAPYAVYQEFGTRFIPPVRFLSRAIEMQAQSMIDAVNQAIDEAITEASA